MLARNMRRARAAADHPRNRRSIAARTDGSGNQIVLWWGMLGAFDGFDVELWMFNDGRAVQKHARPSRSQVDVPLGR
jgi:hypothetical protein